MAVAQVTLKLTPRELKEIDIALDLYARCIKEAAGIDKTVSTTVMLESGEGARRSLRIAQKIRQDIGLNS